MRVAFLTNMVPPYHQPVLRLLSQSYGAFRIFISTPMEANRPWKPEWSGLDVVVQKSIAFNRKWIHPSGFDETVTIHFPVDTYQQLASFKPDVVLSGEMGARTLLALLYRKLTGRTRLLIWSEVTKATEQGRGLLRALTRRLLARNVDGFLALGAGGVDYIRSLGVPPDKIFQLAYTTGIENFLSLPVVRDEPVSRHLLYAGQLIERKGLIPFLHTVFKWAQANPDRCVEFTIAGNGPLDSALKAMAAPRNVKLMFREALQYEDLPALYGQAGIFALPTLADTWGVVVNEALASAVPVLGSLFSQAVEAMVDEGKTGWTFRPQSEDEVYNALDRAMNCPAADLRQMRLQARQRALDISPEYVAGLIHQAIGASAQEAAA